MFSETDIEIDVQELCSKYNLNYNEYFKIKEIVMQGTTVTEIYPGAATLFFIESAYFNFEKCSYLVIEEFKKTDKFHLIRHGDILYNSTLNEQNEYDGMYFFVKDEYGPGDFVLIKSDDGMIPRVFKTIEDFPAEYWEDPVEVIISGKRIHFFAINSDIIPVSESIEKRIQPVTNESINFFLRHDPEFFDHFNENLLNNKFVRYQNKVYVFSPGENIPPGYICFDDQYYENEVCSRWGIFKALVWFLVLHRRSVIKVNHPDRLKELGVFEI
jgi:hypothetical protein